MLKNIPTHLIAGPLGAGKTSLIDHLLAQRPAHERWAILINEFGMIGLDAALLSRDEDGLAIAEVAGGCLCCVNGVPFQVGLSRLLRKVKPHRLFIEPSGLGHPNSLLQQLQASPWQDVLAVQPLVMVLDAAALAQGVALPESQQQAVDKAGLLVLNKAENLTSRDKLSVAAQFVDNSIVWTSQGQLPLAKLPGIEFSPVAGEQPIALPATGPALGQVWQNPQQPITQVQQQAEGWSIGWRWHPSQHFELSRIEAFLLGLPWRRAKLLLQTAQGCYSANALAQQALHFKSSEWRKDSRLELIFSSAQDAQALTAGVSRCVLDTSGA